MDKNKTFKEVLDENKFLVSIETVKIKDFIFSTNKLKLIRGASYLLDYMNQVEVPRILRKYGLEYNTKGLVDKIYDISDDEEFLRKVDEKIDGAIDKRILYVGAGNAKFLVENEKDAKNICKEIKELYSEIAPSAKVVAEFHPMEKDEKIWDAIDELAQKTAEKKSEGFPMLNIDLPFAVKCDLSGTEPAVVSWKSIKSVENDLDSIDIHKSGYDWKLNNEKRNSEGIVKFQNDTDKQKKDTIKAIENVIKESGLNISEESAVKIKYSNKMIKDDVNEIGFYSIIKKALKDDIHLNTEIDDYAVGDNFIGFIYSDGDGLGDFLKNVKKVYTTGEEYLKFMRKFSVILDRNTKYVLKEVIKEMYEKGKFMKKKPILKDGKFVKDEKGENIEKSVIGEFLIVGGDDVCAVFPADLALEISAEFQKQFEEKMNKFTENENKNNEVKNSENITSSCGVVIAKGKTPMFQLFEQGLKLQKLAKGKRYNENQIRDEKAKRTGYIDFQVIGNEGNVDIKGYRKKWFDKFDNKKNENKLHISKRPYSINKIDDDVSESIDKLIENVKDLKKENFPNTKIRYIYDLKKDETKTDNEKIMESINILSKMSEEDIQVLNKLWGIKDKMKLDFNNENKEFKKLFDNIFDVLEIYDFIQKDEKSLEKEDNKSGN
ncbi:hypothetical protein JMUB4039_1182 [Leptotrichia trevisanii]|uniref:Cas10/Cmr2 second palm domain-containing protein n=1 Tax=Leptotrichia trevisanii TaxID=109328 RepID=UPI00118C72B1|nr:hypothetical protein [Leptotrichia trevisanii]BBM57204.1 hypothetical protein JMUB4039_1182 [Leptotrichia trevisanii]